MRAKTYLFNEFFARGARFSKTVNILSKYEKRRIFSTLGQGAPFRAPVPPDKTGFRRFKTGGFFT